jgi:hypothetical protein
MPRPNPPKKRPRRRPAGGQDAARADAALTRQTAQSTQPRTPSGSSRTSNAGAAVAAPEPDEMWSRRSYAILIGLMAVVQLPITAIQWALAPAVSNGISKGPVYAALAVLNPVSLLVASLFAAPAAKFLSGERRTLRFMETIFAPIVTYFVWLVLAVGAGALLTTGTTTGGTPSSCGTASAVATPLPASASAAPGTPCPSASPQPTQSPRASASASPSASAAANATTITTSSPVVYSTFTLIDIIAFVATLYFYPPLYRRLRVRRPPPPRRDSKK